MSGYALHRTAKIAEELRRQRFSDPDLEDVLQLETVLWHAWKVLVAETPVIRDMFGAERAASGKKRPNSARRSRRGGKKRKVADNTD